MAEQERPEKRGYGFLRLFERGVDTATRNNVTAYGYSVCITAAFAILQTTRSDTGAFEIYPSERWRENKSIKWLL